jgi:L-iditol 2-dehydrogenase
MKAASIRAKGSVIVQEIETPKVLDKDVLVKMRVCGLCGSDLEKVYGRYGMASTQLGHEPSGEVIEIGKSVNDFSPGDRVFLHHHVACYSCYFCRHGDYTMCSAYQKSSINPCGLSEQILVPSWNISHGGLMKLPDSMTFEEASFIEPLACCIRALNKCNIQKGDDIVILGTGPAGIMHAILAKAFGVGRVIVVDINEFRLNFAKKICNSIQTFNSTTEKDWILRLKSLTNSRGADISIVATGNTRALIQAFDAIRKGGKVMLFGVPSKRSKVSLDIDKIYSNELSFISSYAASEVETNQALTLIAEKHIDVKRLITHRFDIKRTQEAIKCAYEADGTMKVVVTSY